jgi:DHA1 family bicyclomycin/chloramphenicol resistance-like MFS transporter
MSLTLAEFKENTGVALAFIHTIRLFGSSILSIVTGYLLVQNLDSLPMGLIACGIGALYFSWRFNQLRVATDDEEFTTPEAA